MWTGKQECGEDLNSGQKPKEAQNCCPRKRKFSINQKEKNRSSGQWPESCPWYWLTLICLRKSWSRVLFSLHPLLDSTILFVVASFPSISPPSLSITAFFQVFKLAFKNFSYILLQNFLQLVTILGPSTILNWLHPSISCHLLGNRYINNSCN